MATRPYFQQQDTTDLADSLQFDQQASNDIWGLGFAHQAAQDIAGLGNLLKPPDPLPVVVSARPDARTPITNALAPSAMPTGQPAQDTSSVDAPGSAGSSASAGPSQPAGAQAMSSGGGGAFANNDERLAYVRQSAAAHGHNPDVAARVAMSEGAGPAGSVGDQGTSFGALQAHVGGGQGDDFKAQTGLDPSDPTNERALIDWQLSNLGQTGWSPFHGAAAAGIGPWEGINSAAPIPTQPNGGATVTPTPIPNATSQTQATPSAYTQQGLADAGDPDAWAKCGPVAAYQFALRTGRNPTPSEVEKLAKDAGWTPQNGMAGFQSEAQVLKGLGIAARAENGVDWDKVITDVSRGNPVILQLPGHEGHYITAQGYDAATGKIDFGSTVGDLRAAGHKTAFTPSELENLGWGVPNAALYVDNPATPAPSVAAQPAQMNRMSLTQPAQDDGGGDQWTTNDSSSSAVSASQSGMQAPPSATTSDSSNSSAPTMLRQPLSTPTSGPDSTPTWQDSQTGPAQSGKSERDPVGIGEGIPGGSINQGDMALPVWDQQPGSRPYDTTDRDGVDTSLSAPNGAVPPPMSPPPNAMPFQYVRPDQMMRLPLGAPTPGADTTDAPTDAPLGVGASAPASAQPTPGAGAFQDDQTQNGYVQPDMAPGPPVPDMSGTGNPNPTQAPASPFKPLYDAYGQIKGYIDDAAPTLSSALDAAHLPNPIAAAGTLPGAANTVSNEGIATPIARGIENTVTRPLLGQPQLADSGQPETPIDQALVESGRSLAHSVGQIPSDIQRGGWKGNGLALLDAAQAVGDLAPTTTLARQLNYMLPHADLPIVGDTGVGDVVMDVAMAHDAKRLGYGAIKIGGRVWSKIGEAIKAGVPAEQFAQWAQGAAGAIDNAIGAVRNIGSDAANALPAEGSLIHTPTPDGAPNAGLWFSKPDATPFTPDEVSQVQDGLSARGIQAHPSPDGTTIMIPAHDAPPGFVNHVQDVVKEAGYDPQASLTAYSGDTAPAPSQSAEVAGNRPSGVTPSGDQAGAANGPALPDGAARGADVPDGAAAASDPRPTGDARTAGDGGFDRDASAPASTGLPNGAQDAPAADRSAGPSGLQGQPGAVRPGQRALANFVPPDVRMGLGTPREIPDDPRLAQAVEAVGGQITDRGVELHVTRAQGADAAGQVATRGGVFVEPVPEGGRSSFVTSSDNPNAVGGSVALPPTKTLYRKPLVIDGPPGGEGFDSIMQQLGVKQLANDDQLIGLRSTVAKRQERIAALKASGADPGEIALAEDQLKNWQRALDTAESTATTVTSNDIAEAIRQARAAGPEGSPARSQALKDLVSRYGGDPSVIDDLLKIRGADASESAWAIKENIVAANARKAGYDGVFTLKSQDAPEAVLAAHPEVAAAQQAGNAINQRLDGLMQSRQGVDVTGMTPMARRAAIHEASLNDAVIKAARDENVTATRHLIDTRIRVGNELSQSSISEIFDVQQGRNPTPGAPHPAEEANKRLEDLQRRAFEAQSKLGYDHPQTKALWQQADQAYADFERHGGTVLDTYEPSAPGYSLHPDVLPKPEPASTTAAGTAGIIPVPVHYASEGPHIGRAVANIPNMAAGRGAIGALIGAQAGAVTGYGTAPDDATPTERIVRAATAGMAGAGVGAATAVAGTSAGAHLIDSLITSGKLDPRVLSSHPEMADRIKALFALAAQGLPDDAPVQVPALAQAIVSMRPFAPIRDRDVSRLLLEPVTAGDVRQMIGDPTKPGIVQTVRGMVIDALSGLGSQGQQGRELAADAATVRGFTPAQQAISARQGVETADAIATANGVANRAQPNADPQKGIVNFVNDVTDQLGLRRPTVYISDDARLNASASSDGGKPVVVITRGLLNSGLTDDEMQAVITHELAHTVQTTNPVAQAFGAVKDALGNVLGNGSRETANALPKETAFESEQARLRAEAAAESERPSAAQPRLIPNDPLQQGPSGIAPENGGSLLPTHDFGTTGEVVSHVLRQEQEQARALSIRGASKPGAPAGQGALPTMEQPAGLVQRIRDAVAPWEQRLNIVRYSGMLSDSATQIANTVGNAAMQGVDVAATPIAAALDAGRSAVTGKPRQVFFSEVPARLAGMRAGARVGLQNAAEILRTGIHPADAAKQMDRGAAGFGTDIPGIAPAGSTAANVADFAFEAPLRALAASDAVFRTMAQGGHLAAEAEAAAKMANGGGKVTPNLLREMMKDPSIVEKAGKLAARTVLQEDRDVTRWYSNAIRSAPPGVGTVVSTEIPFMKTPYNVIAQGVGLTPLGLAGVVQDMAQGKPARDIEYRVARVALGTAVMAAAVADYGSGNLTGPRPTDPKELSTLPPGWQPWSQKVQAGGQTYYVPLAPLGPLALPPVMAILAGEAAKQGKDALSPEWAGRVALGMGQYAAQNTFFAGVSNIGSLFDQRNAGSNIQRQVQQAAAQFSPHVIGGGALGREIQRVMGMPLRDPQGAMEALLATHPATAGMVQPRQDVLGRPSVPNVSGPLATLVRAGQEQDVSVIRAFRKAKEGLPLAPPKQINDPVTKEPKALSVPQQKRWQRVFGQALREGWNNNGNPQDAPTLRNIESDARETANQTVLGLR